MKKFIYVFAISAGGFLLQSCGNGQKNIDGNADSLTSAIDTTIGTMNKNASSVESSEEEFARKAALGGMLEVESGQLALQTTTSAQIKNFAQMMVSDHRKANEELKTIAKMKNINLPQTLDEDHQEKINELKKKTGTDFDKAYVSAMVNDHKETLKLMQDQAKDGRDSDLKAFAVKTAPIVQSHLDMINKIEESMK